MSPSWFSSSSPPFQYGASIVIPTAGERPKLCFIHSGLSASFWRRSSSGLCQDDGGYDDDYDGADGDNDDHDAVEEDDDGDEGADGDKDGHDAGDKDDDGDAEDISEYFHEWHILNSRLQAFKLEVVEVDGNTSQVTSQNIIIWIKWWK